MKYLHTGMIVGEKLPDMIYMEPLKVWVTDASKDKYSIEFLYFILWNKMDVGGAYIAFVYDNDTVVEFYQPKK